MNLLGKISLLVVAPATTMGAALATPAIGLIGNEFPDVGKTTIQLILTFSSFFLLLSLIGSSILTKYVAKKYILLIGILLFSIGGIGPFFAQSVSEILAFRAVLGLGLGLITPVQTAIITDHFEGRQRTKFLGVNSSFNGLGGALILVTAGQLSHFGWRPVFLTYAYGLLILVFTALFIPAVKPAARQNGERGKRTGSIPWSVYGYGLAALVIMLLYYGILVNIADYIVDHQYGTAASAGIVASASLVGLFVSGLTIAPLLSILKKAFIPVLLLLFALAFLGVGLANSLFAIILSVGIIGFTQSTIFTYVINKTSNAVPPHLMTTAFSIILGFLFIGQFISPVVINSVMHVLHIGTLRSMFFFISAVVAAASVAFAAVPFFAGKLRKRGSELSA